MGKRWRRRRRRCEAAIFSLPNLMSHREVGVSRGVWEGEGDTGVKKEPELLFSSFPLSSGREAI